MNTDNVLSSICSIDRERPNTGTVDQSIIPEKLRKATALRKEGRLEDAITICLQINLESPKHLANLKLISSIMSDQKRYDDALIFIDQALAINPEAEETNYLRGNLLVRLGRFDEALSSYDQALRIKPDRAETLHNRGFVLGQMNSLLEAIESYDRALTIRADYSSALTNRGNAQMKLGLAQEALVSFDRALALCPDAAGNWCNRADALAQLFRTDDALASYARALEIRPDYAEALNNRGNVLLKLERLAEAVIDYGKAHSIALTRPDILSNFGKALMRSGRYDNSAKVFEKLVEVAPDTDLALGSLIASRLHCCDWKDYDRLVERIEADVHQGKRSIEPFNFLRVSNSLAAQKECARSSSAAMRPAQAALFIGTKKYDHNRIRLAYVNAEFRDHANSYLAAGLYEAHDRNRFELTAISLSVESESAMGQRVKRAFDRFVDVTEMTDLEAAALMHELEIDIAIDLRGYSRHCRPGIFSYRPSPVQVNFLGFPGTLGAEYMDYIIADRVVIPEDEIEHYTEKVVYLPYSYQVNDSKRDIWPGPLSRQDVGLPLDAFVFCCFNNPYKYSPEFFSVWMRLLHRLPGSVLWLYSNNSIVNDNILNEAKERGISSDRIIFAQHVELTKHLARLRLADLFLDTLPYNAHTTASDALWAGVPLLTCTGRTFAGRVGASLLHAVGLPELVMTNLHDYEVAALKIGRSPTLLSKLRGKLLKNRALCPLFDTEGYCRHIEQAYIHMWKRSQRGEPPASFAIR